MMKAHVGVAFAAAVVLASGASALAEHRFADVPDDNQFAEAIAWAADNGITVGCDGQGNFCPTDFTTREQMVEFLYRLSGDDPDRPNVVDADTVDGLDSTELRGQHGTDGTNGTQGEQGIQGEPGTDGTNGTNGTDGTNGAQGEQGIQGEPGTDGTNGAQGDQGIQGEPGTDGTNGAQGEQGVQGEPGTDGTNGAQGDQGIQGEPGTDGTNGTNGAQGEQGPAGDSGTQVGVVADDAIVSWPTGPCALGNCTVTNYSGLYTVMFPPGTFTGFEGQPLVHVVSLYGAAVIVDFWPGTVAADGSGYFSIQVWERPAHFRFTFSVTPVPLPVPSPVVDSTDP